jgi:hypothetical protein
MTTEKQPSHEGKPGGKSNRRRPFRGRRRDRRPGAEGEGRSEQPQPAAAKEKSLDQSQRERRERRRRRRLQTKQQGAADLQVNSLAQDEELNRPSPRVVVYTHVIRPDVRDSYEFRSEHFSKVTRRLEDFKIDLEPFFRSQEEEERRMQNAIVEDLADELTEDDADWDADDWDDDLDDNLDETALIEDLAANATLAESPTVDELEDFNDTDPDAGDESAAADDIR